MDPTRFDEFTRTLATTTSRRHAFRALAATAVGGIFGLGQIDDALAKKRKCRSNGKDCNNDHQCCSGNCDSNGVCVAPCRANSKGCTADSQCCSGNCNNSFGGTGTCVAPCLPNTRNCTADNQCCSGNCNNPPGGTGTCQPACLSTGRSCTADNQCCSGNCNNAPGGVGVCQAPCIPKGRPCDLKTPEVCCSKTCQSLNNAPATCA